MKTAPTWFRWMMATLSALAPRLATDLAERLFWSLGEPALVRDRDRATHERAVVDEITVRDAKVVTYRWGDAAHPTVILVHGWRSRASRFAALIDALLDRGYGVVAFDAPGNGDSTGHRTTVYDYVTAIQRLASQHAPVAGIVGHSFGAIATSIAVRRGVEAPVVVTVAGAHDFDFMVQHFAEQLGVRGRAARALRDRIDRVGTRPEIRELVHGDLWTDIVARIDDPSVHLLAVHDAADTSVPLSQSEAIVAGHRGSARLVVTRGLGHSALLADDAVVTTIVDELASSREAPHP